MALNKLFSICAMLCLIVLTSCSISYQFNGASIDYSKTKSITLEQFPIRSSYVWGPMSSIFNTELTDVYAKSTRLQQVKRNGDLVISGEITDYSQMNQAVGADGYSAQIQLKMTVNVRFTNNANHDEDFERQFSATTQYDSKQQLSAVQEELVTQMCKDIVDQIFNATVANW